MQVIHFTRGATDPIDDFDAQGERFVPLAGGRNDSGPTVSCIRLTPRGRIAETPCIHDCALLVVQGRLSLTEIEYSVRLDLSAGVGVVLSAGEPVQRESEEGATVVAVESPRLTASARGRSTPDRVPGQHWPGERPSRRTLGALIRSVRYSTHWWRLVLARPCRN